LKVEYEAEVLTSAWQNSVFSFWNEDLRAL